MGRLGQGGRVMPVQGEALVDGSDNVWLPYDLPVLDMRTSLTHGLHESRHPAVLREVQGIWQALVERAQWPWPALQAIAA